MLDKLKEVFRQFTFLGPNDLVELASIIKIKQLKKGEHLVKVGEYNYNAVKVLKGLLYHYITDEAGTEKALLFVPEKMNSGAMQTMLMGKPADENIIALEDTLMLCTDIRELEKVADKNIRIQKMVNQLYKQIIAEAAERIRFLVINTPEERYLHFRKTYPNLEQRVKQKDLASYLCTTYAENLSAHDLVKEIHECFNAFDKILEKHNIEKIKTVGDAYLAASGLPVTNPNHAQDTINAAIEIREFMLNRKKKNPDSFEIRIGIHSGHVVAGIVGVRKFAYDIWGDTVNTAARMEQHSEGGKINISQTTYELVKDKVNCEYRGEIEAKNKGKLKMYFVN